VIDCAVVGQEVDGLVVPRAYVVVRAPVTADELKEHAKAQLAKHKYPREVVFMTELPRTANGKLDRRALVGRV
jgi:acyl-coenzyme A synthetase/AMP-(fatty) acid ligase